MGSSTPREIQKDLHLNMKVKRLTYRKVVIGADHELFRPQGKMGREILKCGAGSEERPHRDRCMNGGFETVN